MLIGRGLTTKNNTYFVIYDDAKPINKNKKPIIKNGVIYLN